MVTAARDTAARRVACVLVAAAAGLLIACTSTRNYLDPAGPKFEGSHADASENRTCGANGGNLKAVTFNIEYSREIDKAITLLTTSAPLRGMDVLLLQEMDAPGVERIAAALGLNYVYFPSTVHPMAHHDYGAAVLSPWPLDDARKLVLPHAAAITNARRAATSAVVRCGAVRIRVMAVHLPAPAALSSADREEQIEVILRDLGSTADPIILGGDFNSRSVGGMIEKRGFHWLTNKLPGTSRGLGWWWSNDHVFVRGLGPAGGGPAAGVVDPQGASDHRAVWVRVALQNVK